MNRVIILFLLSFSCNISLQAQILTGADVKQPKKSYGILGFQYSNNSVYFGRADSLRIPYLTPSIEYYDKSGFYIMGYSSVLMSAGENRIDMSSVSGGYSFEKGSLYGDFNIEKYFYNNYSRNVSAEVKGATSLSLSYDFQFFQPFINVGINFNRKSDTWLNAGVEKSFEFDHNKGNLNPTFSFNGSTRNFYSAYYSNRRFKRKGVVTSTTASVPDASQFKIMNIEFSIPFEYKLTKSIAFSFSPTYSIPFSSATVRYVTSNPAGISTTHFSTEQISKQFYFLARMEYRF